MEPPAGELSGVISLIIILYIAIIGPGIYLLLKAINKRELLWIVIPGVTIVFVLIMFLMGLTTSAKGENVKSIELNNYTEETTKSYIFGYSSSPGKWTIKTKENYCSARVIMQSNYSVEQNGIIGEIEEGLSNMRLSYSPKRTYQTVSYELKSESKPTGSIEIKKDFTVQDTIKVTNNTGYDLDYLYVSTLFGYDILENVKSGETRDVIIGVPSNNSAYGGQSFNKNGLERDEIRPAYESGDYDKAYELAAIAIGLEAANTGNEEATAIGVTRGPSKTDKDEPSYKCFYTSNVYVTYEEY